MVSEAPISTSKTAVLSRRVMRLSCVTFSSRMVSNIKGFPSGFLYMFSTKSSSIIPPSRAQRLLFPICEVAPNIHNLTSLDAFPPNTGLSCTKATSSPLLAAANAAQTPERPPPATTKSYFAFCKKSSRFSFDVSTTI